MIAKIQGIWPEMTPFGRDRDDEMLYPVKTGDKLHAFRSTSVPKEIVTTI